MSAIGITTKHFKLSNSLGQCIRHISSSTAGIVKIHRTIYERMYPTLVVLQDGSTIRIRYHEPVQIIKLPYDLSGLSEQEIKRHVEKKRPKKKMNVTEDIKVDFNPSQYVKLIKNKK